MALEDGGDLFPERVLDAPYRFQIEQLGESGSPGETACKSHHVIRRANRGEQSRDGHEGQISQIGQSADLHTVSQTSQQIGDPGKLHELQVQQTRTQYERTNGFRITLLFSGEHLAEHLRGIGRRISNNPSEWRSYLDGLPAALGLGVVEVFPLVELHLGRYGFERKGEFGPEIEWTYRYAAV